MHNIHFLLNTGVGLGNISIGIMLALPAWSPEFRSLAWSPEFRSLVKNPPTLGSLCFGGRDREIPGAHWPNCFS